MMLNHNDKSYKKPLTMQGWYTKLLIMQSMFRILNRLLGVSYTSVPQDSLVGLYGRFNLRVFLATIGQDHWMILKAGSGPRSMA